MQELQLYKVKILLVEDAIDIQLLVDRILRLQGAEVHIAENGKVAVEKIGKNEYDIILMDLQMPIMDGYEATSVLRKSGYKKPIIALTAHALKEDRIKCLKSGFDEHLSKPIERNRLVATLALYSFQLR